MATVTTSALQAKALSMALTVNDVQQSIRFFEGLGFAVGERWDQEGSVVGAMMKSGDVQIGLMQDDWKKGRDRQKGVGMRLFVTTTQNIDEVAARARQAGVTIDAEPHDTEWGTRAFEVTEPSGFKITVTSHLEPS